jgi:hypothetical protein
LGTRSAPLFIRVVCLAVLAGTIALPLVSRPASAAPNPVAVEASVLHKVDAGSPGSFERHAGLVEVSRSHSREMAARKELSHDGADDRPESALPDPAETNGSPDDGHAPPSVSCENVAYVFPADKDPASEIYRLWLESPSHKACMDRTDTNVAGVGVHYDGERWWATFVAMTDRTPPSGKAAATPYDEPKKDTAVEARSEKVKTEKPPDAAEQRAETDAEPTSVSAPAPTQPAAETPGPKTTSFAEATVELPPVERVVAQAPAPVVVPARAKGHRPPVPQSVLIGVIVLALMGTCVVWRSSKQQPVEQTE